jgi:hypothetical protein
MIALLSPLLMALSDAFARQATFHWFVVAVVGLLMRLDNHGVSSTIRWLRIRPGSYEPFLAFFRSKGLKLGKLQEAWQLLVCARGARRTSAGALVLLGDGIKVAKEAERMPGVKRLHQESDNSGKAPWIEGHHFGVVGVLAGTGEKSFCVPVAAELHEGVPALRELQGKAEPEVLGAKKTTVVTLMAHLIGIVVQNLGEPCVAVLDAYFSVADTFRMAQTVCDTAGQRLLHIVTRAKGNVVAYEDPPTEYSGHGRPRKYGKKLKLNGLFTTLATTFESIKINVYDEVKVVSILCLDLQWKPIEQKLRFVLVKDGAARFILMCSDRNLSPREIVELYGSRFKIEVTFKTLKHVMGGFAYHFWTSMWRDEQGRALQLEQLEHLTDRAKRLIADAMNAIEAFVNIALIATGVLQLLAIDCTEEIRKRHRWWMRTYSSEVPSEEMVRNVLRHEFYHNFRVFKHTAIHRIIRKKTTSAPSNPMKLAA